MGAWVAFTPRSDRMMKSVPSATAALARRQTSAMARSSPAAPSLTGNRIGMVTDLKPWRLLPSRQRSLSSSSLVRIGDSSEIWRAERGVGSNKLYSAPMVVSIDMMISSRMQSTGGLVTWANICWK